MPSDGPLFPSTFSLFIRLLFYSCSTANSFTKGRSKSSGAPYLITHNPCSYQNSIKIFNEILHRPFSSTGSDKQSHRSTVSSLPTEDRRDRSCPRSSTVSPRPAFPKDSRILISSLHKINRPRRKKRSTPSLLRIELLPSVLLCGSCFIWDSFVPFMSFEARMGQGEIKSFNLYLASSVQNLVPGFLSFKLLPIREGRTREIETVQIEIDSRR